MAMPGRTASRSHGSTPLGLPPPTGGVDAHDSLRKVLGYVHADIVEAACTRIPLTRDAVGPAGTVVDPARARADRARHSRRSFITSPIRSSLTVGWLPEHGRSQRGLQAPRVAPQGCGGTDSKIRPRSRKPTEA